MRNRKMLTAILTVVISVSALASLASGRPIPEPSDYAKFVQDPYIKADSVVIYYSHPSQGWMYIRLYNPSNQEVGFWPIPSGWEDEIVYDVTPAMGIWRLEWRWLYYGWFHDYATMYTPFIISDPEQNQQNLGTDWARNPNNPLVYKKAFVGIIGTTTSSYDAAYAIYSHVRGNFVHDIATMAFRSDLQLLGDLNDPLIRAYHGTCRCNAVILTSYARSVGIPARIIHLDFSPLPGSGKEESTHYFAEFYILNGGSYQWFPVDAHPSYDWFGLNQANQKISSKWPSTDYVLSAVHIVPSIYEAGLKDPEISPPSFPQVDYNPHPYSNTTP